MIYYNKGNTGYNNLIGQIKAGAFSSVCVLCDSNTRELCLPRLENITSGIIKFDLVLEFDPGEMSKTLDTCQVIWKSLLENDFDRNSLLINLGGGVVSDLGGFIASVYKRGVSFINIPTSLLAMVDASIGGKTGADFGNVKNIIGTFNFPLYTIIDIKYLSTLPEKELVNGRAEMFKHALIKDKEHWSRLNMKSAKDIDYETISETIEIKR